LVYKRSFYASGHKIKLERKRRRSSSFFSSCDDNGEDVRGSRCIRKQPWKRTVASLLGCLITRNPKPATSASNRREQLDRGFTGVLSDLFLILGKTDLRRRSEFTARGAAIMNYWPAAPNRSEFTAGVAAIRSYWAAAPNRSEFTGGAAIRRYWAAAPNRGNSYRRCCHKELLGGGAEPFGIYRRCCHKELLGGGAEPFGIYRRCCHKELLGGGAKPRQQAGGSAAIRLPTIDTAHNFSRQDQVQSISSSNHHCLPSCLFN
jgi:hypothetical protein